MVACITTLVVTMWYDAKYPKHNANVKKQDLDTSTMSSYAKKVLKILIDPKTKNDLVTNLLGLVTNHNKAHMSANTEEKEVKT